MTIINAAPMAIHNGTLDLSKRPNEASKNVVPQHCPLLWDFMERGPLQPTMTGGDSLVSLYGTRSLDYRSTYATHGTVGINTVNGEGNSFFMQRVVPTDASYANVVLYLEVVKFQVPVYERNTDNTFLLDINGEKVELKPAATVDGFKVRWVTEHIPTVALKDANLRGLTVKAGTLNGDLGEVSEMYPIHAFEVSHLGAYGNNVGLRLSAPNILSELPANDELYLKTQAFIYRMQFVERPSISQSALTERSIYGEEFVDFAYEEGIVDESINMEMSSTAVILPRYQDLTPDLGYNKIYAPLGKQHIYSDNIKAVCSLFHATEVKVMDSNVLDKPSSVNFVDFKSIHGVPYATVVAATGTDIDGPGTIMNDQATHYAHGGSDGTMTPKTYNAAVKLVADTFENQEWPLLDRAQYPISRVYDTGFDLDTKKSIIRIMGLRKDFSVVTCTQDVSMPLLSAAAEESVAIALRGTMRLYPDSALYGTPAYRGVIISQAGELSISGYHGIVPTSIDYMRKVSRYFGAADGKLVEGAGYDISPNNQVEIVSNVSNLYKTPRIRNKEWAGGITGVVAYDMRSSFFPAIQTVYDDDTSILNSDIVMMICTEIDKVCEGVWRDLTGRSDLSNDEFIAESNRLIELNTIHRFDDRVVVVPDTYFTEQDKQRGYSWSTRINLYANNMKTVGSFTITANRMVDL